MANIKDKEENSKNQHQLLSATDKDGTVEEQVRNLMDDLHNQQLFDSPHSTPVRPDKAKGEHCTRWQTSLQERRSQKFTYNPDLDACSSKDLTATNREQQNSTKKNVNTTTTTTTKNIVTDDDEDSQNIQSGQGSSTSDNDTDGSEKVTTRQETVYKRDAIRFHEAIYTQQRQQW